jgi:hypothetical protein
MRLKKNCSISEAITTKASMYQSQAVLKDKPPEEETDDVLPFIKNNHSFRPRRPIVNPVEQARLE